MLPLTRRGCVGLCRERQPAAWPPRQPAPRPGVCRGAPSRAHGAAPRPAARRGAAPSAVAHEGAPAAPAAAGAPAGAPPPHAPHHRAPPLPHAALLELAHAFVSVWFGGIAQGPTEAVVARLHGVLRDDVAVAPDGVRRLEEAHVSRRRAARGAGEGEPPNPRPRRRGGGQPAPREPRAGRRPPKPAPPPPNPLQGIGEVLAELERSHIEYPRSEHRPLLFAASEAGQRAYALVEGRYQDVGALPGHPATFRVTVRGGCGGLGAGGRGGRAGSRGRGAAPSPLRLLQARTTQLAQRPNQPPTVPPSPPPPPPQDGVPHFRARGGAVRRRGGRARCAAVAAAAADGGGQGRGGGRPGRGGLGG
jgi:hypothetical protein